MRRFKLVFAGAAVMATMAVYAAPAMAATAHETMGKTMSHENNNSNLDRDDRNVNGDDRIFSNSLLDDVVSPEFFSFEGFDSI